MVLNRMRDLSEMNDIDLNVLKLQSIGFNLDYINTNGYSVIGIFRHNNSIKEISIPIYKINEDILDQLKNLIEEYNKYILEEQNLINKNDQSIRIAKEFINLNSAEINWDKIYNNRTYAQILLNTAVELLYSKLNEELEIIK